MSRVLVDAIDPPVDPAILRIAEETRARMAACFRPERRIVARSRAHRTDEDAGQTAM